MKEKLQQQHRELSARYDKLVQKKKQQEAVLDQTKAKIQETIADMERLEKMLYPSNFSTDY